MNRLALSEYAYPIPAASGIGERNTVSNGPDDGGNNNIARVFWKNRRHSTTTGMADNALALPGFVLKDAEQEAARSGGSVNIAGHGNEGLLETGMGQTGPFSEDTLIYLYNETHWGPQLDRLNDPALLMLSIYSCHTGAGQGGADLLYAMAKRCGRAVRAGTGLLMSTSKPEMWWEPGTVWQVATPAKKPEPIPPPSFRFAGVDKVQFVVNGSEEDSDSVVEIQIEGFAAGSSIPFINATASGSKAVEFATKLLFSPLMEFADMRVAGFRTATVRLTFKSGSTLELNVYNDRLAVDPIAGIAIYVTSSPLQLALLMNA